MSSNQHYAAYVYENGDLRELDRTVVDTYHEINGIFYHFNFEYAVHNSRFFPTYEPRYSNSDDLLDPIQFLEYPYCIIHYAVETDGQWRSYPMYYNVETGGLTDLYRSLPADLRTMLCGDMAWPVTYLEGSEPDFDNLSPENTRFLASHFYVDMPNQKVYDLNQLVGTALYGECVVAGTNIFCRNERGDIWKIDTADMSATQVVTPDSGSIVGALEPDMTFVFYKENGVTHIYDFLNETDTAIDAPAFTQNECFYSGRRMFAYLPDEDPRDNSLTWLIFDCDKMQFLRFTVENQNEYLFRQDEDYTDSDLYRFVEWLPDGRLVLTSREMHEFLVYTFR